MRRLLDWLSRLILLIVGLEELEYVSLSKGDTSNQVKEVSFFNSIDKEDIFLERYGEESNNRSPPLIIFLKTIDIIVCTPIVT